MATFENSQIVAEIIANNGVYNGDPIPRTIFSFKIVPDGPTVYNVCYTQEEVTLFLSAPLVSTFFLLWHHTVGPTQYGADLVEQQGFSQKNFLR